MSRRRAVILVGNPARPYSRAHPPRARPGRGGVRGRDRGDARRRRPARGARRRHRSAAVPAERPVRRPRGVARQARRPPPHAGPPTTDAGPGLPGAAGQADRVVPVAADRPWLLGDAREGARARRPLPRVRDAPDRRGAGRPRARPEGRAGVQGDLRRHRHHAPSRTTSLRMPPSSIRRLLARRERGWARAADAHTAVNDAFADWAVRHWGLAAPTDGRAQLPRAVDAAGGPAPGPDPRGDRPAAVDPDLPVLGTAGTIRRARPGGRGGAPGARHGARAAGLRAGLGGERGARRRRRATPAATSPCRPSIPTSCRPGSPRPTSAMNSLPPLSYSQRYTFLNKFFEAMTGGLPMVLGPDLPTMEARPAPGGPRAGGGVDGACRHRGRHPRDPRAARRPSARPGASASRTTARERYSWPIAAAAYRELVRSLGLDQGQVAVPGPDATPIRSSIA